MNEYKKRIGISFLLTTVLLLLGGLLFPSLPSSSMESELFWTNKVYPGKKFDVVFIGDSRTYRGIDPVSVKKGLKSLSDLEVFNFGFSSAGFDSLFMNEGAALLDPNSKQAVIVLGITPSSVSDEGMVNAHYKQEKNRSRLELWQRKNINPYFSFFDPTSPSMVRNKLRGKKEGYFQEHHLNGWIASNKIPKDVWKDYWMIEKSFDSATIELEILTKLLDQIKKWTEKGIRVFAFRPPAVKHFEAVVNEKSNFPEKALIAQIEAVGGHWIEIPNRYSYKTYDGNHLEEASAMRLSYLLGEQIHWTIKHQAPTLFKSVQTFDKPNERWTRIDSSKLRKEDVFRGKQSFLLEPTAYSSTYIQKLDTLLNQNLYIRSSCWVKLPEIEKEDQIVLVVSVENKEGAILWQGEQVFEQIIDKSTWNRVMLNADYFNKEANCIVKAYVWNNSKKTILIDDLSIHVSY